MTTTTALPTSSAWKAIVIPAAVGGLIQVLLTGTAAIIGKIPWWIAILLCAFLVPITAIAFLLFYRYRQNSQTQVAKTELERIINSMGITSGTAMTLQGSKVTPEECIERTRKRLYFMGVLASKWVLDPRVRSEFERMLSHLDQLNGDCRFLIIDPESAAFKRLQAIRDGDISTDSVNHLRTLTADHPSFNVRKYTTLPTFRIVAIDNELVSFSSYHMKKGDYARSRYGWESPHLVLDPKSEWPIADAFVLLFEETWDAADPLGK